MARAGRAQGPFAFKRDDPGWKGWKTPGLWVGVNRGAEKGATQEKQPWACPTFGGLNGWAMAAMREVRTDCGHCPSFASRLRVRGRPDGESDRRERPAVGSGFACARPPAAATVPTEPAGEHKHRLWRGFLFPGKPGLWFGLSG